MGNHKLIINRLERRLINSPFDYSIFTNLVYGNPKRLDGEIDLIAKHNDYILLFEIKSIEAEHSTEKAHEQLSRALSYALQHHPKKVFLFEVYGYKHSKTDFYLRRYNPK